MKFPKNKPIRLNAREMGELRMRVFERDGGCCVRCKRPVRLENGGFENMHLAHIVGRGAGGSDTEENTQTKCLWCHIGVEHSFGKSGEKPCPKKPAPEAA